ncbi:MAG TPA: hypothetical protein VM011_09125 [Gammaproteobacteria bacterium]|nr:hypothetical protein [Gammaproteobacteria bacterium]
MPDQPRTPGVTRENRISDEGLQRLEQQLRRGGQISDAVLAQWIRRYGDAAREIIARHGRTPGKQQDPG